MACQKTAGYTYLKVVCACKCAAPSYIFPSLASDACAFKLYMIATCKSLPYIEFYSTRVSESADSLISSIVTKDVEWFIKDGLRALGKV